MATAHFRLTGFHRRHFRPARVAVSLIGFLAAAGALGWSPETQRAAALDAARLAPPGLAGQLERHARELQDGAVEPFTDADPRRHMKNPDGSGELDAMLLAEVSRAIDGLRAFRPFSEVARRLGRVAHWTADLNNPLNASAADPAEGRYFRDFLIYAESARPRLALVLYENEATVSRRQDLSTLADLALARGRELYPMIGLEYRRIDFGAGIARFDDRSTAFGVAALAYSHAVTDTARVFRYIWLASGGDDPRGVLDRPRDRVLLVPRSAP